LEEVSSVADALATLGKIAEVDGVPLEVNVLQYIWVL